MHMHTRGRLGALEHLADFAAGKPLLRLQQHCGALLRRELRERGSKPAYRLFQHGLILGTGLARRRIESAFVGIVAGTRQRRHSLPPSMLALMVDAQVDQYPVEPGRKARPAVEAPGRFVQADESVLRDVARVGPDGGAKDAGEPGVADAPCRGSAAGSRYARP